MEIIILLISFVACAFAIDPNVTIIDEAPKMIIGVSGRKEMIATKDKDVFMTCVVHNKPADKKVEWRAIAPDNTNIEISEDQDSKDAYRYQIDQPSAISWRVKIQNIQIADEMRYICQVDIGLQKYATEERYIRVTEKPQIMDLLTSSNQLVEEGDPVQLTCNCTGWPRPNVRWSKVAGGLLPSGGQEYAGYTLNLGNSRPDHRGYYKCTCQNMVGKDARIVYLGVVFKPTIQVGQMEPAQAYGYQKTLECVIEAYPVPSEDQITWTHENIPVPSSAKIKYIEGAMNRVTTKLTIRGVDPNALGLYTCQASNTKGSTQANINLKYSSQPTPDITGEIIRSGASLISISITTLLMLVTVGLLHTCKV
ncbi:protein amalgam-like [Mytilus trossulus]|uniref:protein amalgam-like n=1 Tax=Mytilus trossulus TaxID=6551 RepID=UPI003004E46E